MKRTIKSIHLLTAFACALSVAASPFAWNVNAAGSVSDRKGDVSCDGRITVSDAILLARINAEDAAVSVTPDGMDNADMNHSGAPDQDDLVLMLKELAGLDTAANLTGSDGSMHAGEPLAVTTSASSPVPAENTAPTTTQPTEPVREHISENGNLILFWEEKNFGEKYPLASGAYADGTDFTAMSDKSTVSTDRIGERIGTVTLSGYDVYSDEHRTCQAEAFRMVDDTARIAVKAVDEEAAYYVYALTIS